MTAPASIVGVARPTWRIYRDMSYVAMHHRRGPLIGISAFGLAFGILLLVMGSAMSVWLQPWQAWITVSAGVLGLLLAVFVGLYVRWAWRSANAVGALDERCTVTPDHVAFESRQGSIRVLAPAVTKVHTAPDFWMVRATAYPPLGICRDAFTPADAAAVDAMLAGYGPRTTT